MRTGESPMDLCDLSSPAKTDHQYPRDPSLLEVAYALESVDPHSVGPFACLLASIHDDRRLSPKFRNDPDFSIPSGMPERWAGPHGGSIELRKDWVTQKAPGGAL